MWLAGDLRAPETPQAMLLTDGVIRIREELAVVGAYLYIEATRIASVNPATNPAPLSPGLG